MKEINEIEPFRLKLLRWVETGWLMVSNPTFLHTPDKRQAYYDYRLSKIYDLPCY
jgi:hypothetical protein